MPNGVFVDNAHDELVVANWEHRSIEFYARNWNGPRPARSARSRLRRTCRSSVSAIPGRWRSPRRDHRANCVSHPGFTSYERSSDGAVYPKRHVEGNNTQMSRSIHNLRCGSTRPTRDGTRSSSRSRWAARSWSSTARRRQRQAEARHPRAATKLDDNEGVTVDDKEIAVTNHDSSILIFPRLGNGNIAPLRQITYQAGNKDPATGAWLGPWGEGSSIALGPAIWLDRKGTGDPGDDEIVVRARYTVRDRPPTER